MKISLYHINFICGYCLYYKCLKPSVFCVHCLTNILQSHKEWCIDFKEIREAKLIHSISPLEQERQEYQDLNLLIECLNTLNKKKSDLQSTNVNEQIFNNYVKIQSEHQNIEHQEQICKQLLELLSSLRQNNVEIGMKKNMDEKYDIGKIGIKIAYQRVNMNNYQINQTAASIYFKKII